MTFKREKRKPFSRKKDKSMR